MSSLYPSHLLSASSHFQTPTKMALKVHPFLPQILKGPLLCFKAPNRQRFARPTQVLQNTRFNITFAIMNMAAGQSGDPEKIRLDNLMNRAKELWDSAPQPVKSFPWNKVLDNFIQLILDLFVSVVTYLSAPLLAVTSLSEMSYCAHQKKLHLVPLPLLIGFLIAWVLNETALELSPTLKAAAVAEKAAKTISENVVPVEEEEESSQGEGEEEDGRGEGSEPGKETGDESDRLRKSTLDKLEKASSDSILGQGLKVLDHSVENFASGAWQAFGSAWKGGSTFVQKLESSAVNLAESIQHGNLPGAAGSVAPSLLETGKAFTAKGMQVLEYVGKETIDLLISETGIEVDKNFKGSEREADEDQLLEEVTFDRCFYIYGGPEQLEELEALSNHYALLFNRRKAKLPAEQKTAYDEKLKIVQQIFNLAAEISGIGTESVKGKKVETGSEGNSDEMKSLHDSSLSKAADMAAGFASALSGLTINDMIQRTASRIETLHSEGVHRLSEMCCSAVTQLLILGKSLISHANNAQKEDGGEDLGNIEWPEDSVEKARVIRTKTQTMTGYMEAVSNSFITGISDVSEAYAAALKGATADSHEDLPQASIQEKVKSFSELLSTDRTTALGKIQDGLQYLSYVVISTSMVAP